uniref:Uncharacterized protein n=1 Tax=Parascaris univalens TaxID=6257 RepID=A0A915ALA2_PARUN
KSDVLLQRCDTSSQQPSEGFRRRKFTYNGQKTTKKPKHNRRTKPLSQNGNFKRSFMEQLRARASPQPASSFLFLPLLHCSHEHVCAPLQIFSPQYMQKFSCASL